MMGDVMVMTSVLPGLAKKYPGATIDFCTNVGYDASLENNPYIHQVVRSDDGSYDLVLRIDHSDQWDAPMNAVHCRIAGVEVNPPELYFTDAELQFGKQYEVCIAFAHTAGWVSRRYRHWPEVVTSLRKKYRLVQIDNGAHVVEGIEHPSLDVRHAMSVVNAAGLYLGVDSLFMHVAAACCVPQVVVMCATGAELQYMPCSTVIRPFPFKSIWDADCVGGIEIEPEIVIGEVVRKISSPQVIVQRTDEEGRII